MTASAEPDDHQRPARMDRLAVIGATVCAAIWGANSAAVKVALPSFPPLLLSGLRFGLACLVTAPWVRVQGLSLRLSWSQWRIVTANGLLLFLQIGTFTLGTAWSESIHSVILINLYPFFTAIFSHFWLPDHPLTRSKSIGLVIAFVGVVLMFADDLAKGSLLYPEGDALLLVSAAILGAKVAYNKQMLGEIHIFQNVVYEALIAATLFFLASSILETLPASRVAPAAVAAVLYQAWIVSGVGFLWWSALLMRYSPNDLSSFSFLTPVFGVFIGWLALGEAMDQYLLMGGALITIGIHQVTRG